MVWYDRDMSDFYREKAKEDQLKKQADEIYEMLESSQAWMPEIAKDLEKKIIMKEIENTSYEEVLASKLKIIQKANKWEANNTTLIIRIIGVVIAISFLVFLFNLDETTLKDLFG